MRCKCCDMVLGSIHYNERSKKWTELCGTCTVEGSWVTYAPGKFNDYPEDRKPVTWDLARGPRPACLDWTDSQVLEYIYKSLGLSDDFEVLKQIVGDIDVELSKSNQQA